MMAKCKHSCYSAIKVLVLYVLTKSYRFLTPQETHKSLVQHIYFYNEEKPVPSSKVHIRLVVRPVWNTSSLGFSSRTLLHSHVHLHIYGKPSSAFHLFKGRWLAWSVRMEEALIHSKKGWSWRRGSLSQALRGQKQERVKVRTGSQWPINQF